MLQVWAPLFPPPLGKPLYPGSTQRAASVTVAAARLDNNR